MSRSECMIAMNNKGVDLMEAGQFKDALMMLNKGLALATKCVRKRKCNSSFFTNPESIQWSRNLWRQPGHCATSPFLYARAMRVGKETSFSKSVLGALTFNFALTSHLRCMEIGEKGWDLMRKALKIYSKSLTLLRGSPLCLVVLNNMRLIYHDIGDHQAANVCRYELRKTLHTFPLFLKMDENKGLCKDIMLNLFALNEPTLASAA
mmetsp:Transcript_16657/g.23471  ORF Transcript_16657/g.23471 Transcript_16657/m.23471 type:complete len:207 (-) Transcript_16657:90-710(-)